MQKDKKKRSKTNKKRKKVEQNIFPLQPHPKQIPPPKKKKQ